MITTNYNAAGWIGHNHLNVRVDQRENQVTVDGSMGSSRVHLQEEDGRISGYVSTMDGFLDVNVQVDRAASGRSYSSGWVGRDNYRLDSRPHGQSHDLYGSLGDNRIDLTRTDRETSSDVSGWINAGGGLGENVNVQIYSSQPLAGAAMESLYPLLGLTGAALKVGLNS